MSGDLVGRVDPLELAVEHDGNDLGAFALGRDLVCVGERGEKHAWPKNEFRVKRSDRVGNVEHPVATLESGSVLTVENSIKACRHAQRLLCVPSTAAQTSISSVSVKADSALNRSGLAEASQEWLISTGRPLFFDSECAGPEVTPPCLRSKSSRCDAPVMDRLLSTPAPKNPHASSGDRP